MKTKAVKDKKTAIEINSSVSCYHLIAGEVVFNNPETQDTGVVRLNAIVQTKDGKFGTRQLGQAQQSLQMLFFKNIGDEKLIVLDVVILSVSVLGYMTEEEFQSPPEGMVMQEIPPPTEDPFDSVLTSNTIK